MILLIFYTVRFLNFIVLVVVIKKLVSPIVAIISHLSLSWFNNVCACLAFPPRPNKPLCRLLSHLDPNKPLRLSAPIALSKYEYNLNPRNMAIIRTKMLHWELLM